MSNNFQLQFGLSPTSPTEILVLEELGWIQSSKDLIYLHTFQEMGYIPDEENWQWKTWFADYLHLFYDRFCPLNPETAGKVNAFE